MEELVENQLARNAFLIGNKPERCEDCIRSKFEAQPFPKHLPARKSNRVNELIHSDVVGPIAESFGEKRFFVLFIYDFSRYVRVAFLSRKG